MKINWRFKPAKSWWSVSAAALMVTLGNVNALAQTYDGPNITFAQILQNPGNASLNMNYARQQAQNGNVVSALGAVERILLSDPDNDEARSYYVSLLLQVDDAQAAVRELKALEARSLPPQLQQTVNSYRREAGLGGTSESKASDTGSVQGILAVGIRYDDNAGNALIDVTVPGPSNSDDFAGFVQGALRFKTPISEQGNTHFRAGVDGQMVRYFEFSRVDNETFGGHVGISGGDKSLKWHLDGVARQVYIDNTKYLTQYGPKLRLMSQISPETRLHATAAYYDQNYDDIPLSFGENARSGDLLFGQVGVEQKVGKNTVLGAFASYTDKSAQIDAFEYDGIGGKIVLNHYSDNQSYFRALGTYQKLNYGGAFSRKDDRWRLQATLGAPLPVIFGTMGGDSNDALDQLALEGSVRYTDRGSNIGGFDFDSIGAEMRLVWNF